MKFFNVLTLHYEPWTSKDAIELICVVSLLLSVQSTLKCSLFPSEIPFEKTKFLFTRVLSVGDNFWVRNGFWHPLLISRSPVHSSSVSGSSSVPWSCWWRGLASLVLSIPSGSYTLCVSSFTEFPKPGWGIWWKRPI